MRNDVSIIGAGTAGLIAARKLGELGIEATVYDQKRRLGLPVRASGILSISGLSTLGMDYSGCVTNSLVGANVHADGRVMRIRSKRPVAYVLDRKMLNDRCQDHAVAEGAVVVTGRRMGGAELDRLSGNGIVIGADGAVSSVASHFGMGGSPGMVLTWKAEYDAVAAEEGVVDLFFDNRSCRGLFAWVCPNSRDVIEVGVGVDARYGNAKAAFREFVSGEQIGKIVGGRQPASEGASVIPAGMRRHIVRDSPRVMLIGDAAGQVKPTTGGGVIFGGNAAIMAAEAVKAHLDGRGKLSDYRSAFMRKYGLDLAMHSAINRIYSSLGPGMMGRAIDVLNALGVDGFLGEYGDMDRPSLMLKRLFLRSLSV